VAPGKRVDLTVVRYAALVITFLCLVLGVGLHVWSTMPARAGRQYSMQLPVVMCYALTAALVLFLFFPESSAQGSALGFSLSGATALFLLFVIFGLQFLTRVRRHDELAAQLAELERENKQLRQQPKAIQQTKRHRYRLRADRRRTVGIIAGNIKDVIGIDVWVNSENTRMEMARPDEPTISGIIRYYGARHDDTGYINDDIIKDELRAQMAGRVSVIAATALATSSGQLADSHGVKRIVHVATVDSAPGAGFRQIRDIGQCVNNVLAKIDSLNLDGADLSSVVFPLLGTGTGAGDAASTIATMLSATLSYLGGHKDSRLSEIYFLAFTDVAERQCRETFDREDGLQSMGQRHR
jgi:O-acetyl-ADP-ribose deacetylase (regulator of RNase III)